MISAPAEKSWGVAALAAKRDAIRKHQAVYAAQREQWIKGNPLFYGAVKKLLRFIIEPQKRVLSLR